MKKLAILAFSACILTSMAVKAAEVPAEHPKKPEISREEMRQIHKAREAAFEKKLGLTEDQKVQARVLREQAHAKMKPIMDQIRDKKQEAKMVKLSRMAVQAQEEKLNEIDSEIKKLEKELHAIRKSNMKQFESLLTFKQRRILKQMKKEGRQRFDREHRPLPPNSSRV